MTNMIATGIYFFTFMIVIAILIAVRINYSRTQQGKLFIYLCINVIGWLGADAAVLLVNNVDLHNFIFNFGQAFMGFSPGLLFLILYDFFLPEKKLPKWAVILVLIYPVLNILVVTLSPFHDFARAVESVTLWPREIVYSVGPWWTLHMIYGYIMSAASGIVLVYALIKSANKTGCILFIIAFAFLLVANVSYQFNIIPMDIDPTSIGAAFSLLFMHIALTDSNQTIVFRLFNTLKSRITFPVVAVVFVLIVVSVLYAARTARVIVEDYESARITEVSRTIRAYLDAYEQQTRTAARALGGSAELIRRIDSGEREDVWQYVADMKPHLGVAEIIISSADGITIARSHLFDSYGDNISGVPSIAASLRGEFLTLYTPTPTATMVMTSTAPIMDGNRLVGGVVVNFVIGRDYLGSDAFLDNLGAIFNVDATVFRADGTAVSSTLINPETNERDVDILADEEIIDTVLGRGEYLFTDMDLFGFQPYYAYFFPLPGADGNPNAMLFIGISRVDGLATIGGLQRNMLMINVAGLTLAAIFMFFLIFISLKPLDSLAENIKEVAAGNINANVDRSRVMPDEIGMLTLDMYDLSDVLKNIVSDLTQLNQEFNVAGDIEYRADAEKYQNSFREVIESTNSILEHQVKDVLSMLSVANGFAAGDFNVQIDDLPGKKQILPETFRAVAANLKGVNEEIGKMVDAAANKGDLSFKIDEEKYEGGWREIMQGFNHVAEAVNAPIVEIRGSIAVLNDGKFNPPPVTGDYAGNFLAIKNDWNEYIAALPMYMKEISDCLGELADGNLMRNISMELKGDYDQIKSSVNNISANLNKTMSEIHAASEQVLSGAKQISTSAMDLANGANTQASSVQELNASIDLINSQTKSNAESASEADRLSQTSTTNAREGNAAMQQTLDAMNQIKEASNNISKIIRTIQDIAFQTNLLALNAAVEAARAGEHGKGFAVVAEEVRSLAARSQEAASETTSLIGTSISTVDSGAEIARSTAETLDTIVENANKVMSVVSSISSASQDQAEAISQIVGGINQISQVVQSNSAVSEETAAASEELIAQAELLQQLVGYFKL